MKLLLDKYLPDKKVVIVGYGREGKACYTLFRKYFPGKHLAIADINEDLINSSNELKSDHNLTLLRGKEYLKKLPDFDLIVKSPGISLNNTDLDPGKNRITSLTDLFLQAYSSQVIGITGTKGKSTATSLLYTILKQSGKDVFLVGNMGNPPTGILNKIRSDSIIVFELSSHQLEYLTVAPHISILLNLFPEHLDFYKDPEIYWKAKLNILRFQKPGDYFIYNSDDENISELLRNIDVERNFLGFSMNRHIMPGCYLEDGNIIFSKDGLVNSVFQEDNLAGLMGDHNKMNMMAVLNTCFLLDLTILQISEGMRCFEALEHRMEYAGENNGIHFYNDSIATIPEATIAAVKSIKKVDILILGGHDRGLDYNKLVKFIATSSIKGVICTGDAGKRIYDMLQATEYPSGNSSYVKAFRDIIPFIRSVALQGDTCLLSPAAASYGQFENFEERGRAFKKLVLEI